MHGRILEDRYRVESTIDTGGMGVVYRAHDLRLGRDVAVKFAQLPEDASIGGTLAADIQESLFDEARIVSALEHPAIVPVYALGHAEGGQVFVVMKLVAGRTLASLVDDPQSRPSTARQLEILQRIGEALAFAHSRGVVHADLKPANVMVGGFGEVQVMDWGLAAFLQRRAPRSAQQVVATASWSTTARGVVYGTPSYMAPEQVGDGSGIDERTDIFGLGAIGYHMATGNPPYYGASVDEVVRRAVRGERNDPLARHATSAVDRDLLAILDKAMSPRREERYRGVADLLADLSAVRELRPVSARRDGPLRRLQKVVRRHPAVATGVAGTSLLLLASGWGYQQLMAASTLRRVADLADFERAIDRIDLAEVVRSDSVLGRFPTSSTDAPIRIGVARDALSTDVVAAQSRVFARAATELFDLAKQHGAVWTDESRCLASARAIRKGDPRARELLVRCAYVLFRMLHLSGVDVADRSPAEFEDARLWLARDLLVAWLREVGGHALGGSCMEAHRQWSRMRVRVELPTPTSDTPVDDIVFLAFVWSSCGEDEQSLTAFRDAVRKAPSVARVHKGFAVHLLRRAVSSSPEAARPLLETAILHGHTASSLDPESTVARSNYAVALEMFSTLPGRVPADAVRDLATAAEQYQLVLTQDPQHLPALVGIANIRMRRDEPRKALETLAVAQQVAPDDFAVWHMTGLAYDRIVEKSLILGPVQEAIAAFRKAAELRPDWWETHLRLGMALQSDAKHEEAIVSFRKGLAIYPNGKDLRLFLGDSLWETGRHKEAMDTLLALLRDHPDYDDAKQNYDAYRRALPTPELRAEYEGRGR